MYISLDINYALVKTKSKIFLKSNYNIAKHIVSPTVYALNTISTSEYDFFFHLFLLVGG